MVYLLKMVIFHGELLNNQRVTLQSSWQKNIAPSSVRLQFPLLDRSVTNKKRVDVWPWLWVSLPWNLLSIVILGVLSLHILVLFCLFYILYDMILWHIYNIYGWWFQPLWKIWVRQLRWWHSQLFLESHSKFHGSSHHQPDIYIYPLVH